MELSHCGLVRDGHQISTGQLCRRSTHLAAFPQIASCITRRGFPSVRRSGAACYTHSITFHMTRPEETAKIVRGVRAAEIKKIIPDVSVAPIVVKSAVRDVGAADHTSSRCKLCAPLTANTVAGQIAEMEEAKAVGADVVEIRFDYISDFNPDTDIKALLDARVLPAIVTYRPVWEGGKYDGPEEPRLAALRQAVAMGADYVDIELKASSLFFPTLRDLPAVGSSPLHPSTSSPTRIIVSDHNYDFTPSAAELATQAAEMVATGADIVKLVVTAQDICDNMRVLALCAASEVPMIALAMGPRGEISRLLAPKFGGFLTFGILGEGKSTAPGQPKISDLVNLYGLKRLGRQTKVFGVIANPVGHSKSPLLHNAAMREVGFDGIYVPLLVDDVDRFFRTFDSPDFVGFSVTIPHKQAAMRVCHQIDPTAQAIGAVNNVLRTAGGQLAARNTDWEACTAAIEEGLRGREGGSASGLSPLKGRLLVIVGCGGSGRALAFGAKQRGATVVLADHDGERAEELASVWTEHTVQVAALQQPGAAAAIKAAHGAHLDDRWPILAHMTPVGMQPNEEETLFTREMLEGYSVVFDAVYTPAHTRLLTEAAAAGATPVSGMEMFVRQAEEQFQAFTGVAAPSKLMRDIASGKIPSLSPA